jgi:hypothetical protein
MKRHALVTTMLLWGCGGATTTEGDADASTSADALAYDAARADTATSTGISGTLVPDCPTTVPVNGSTCRNPAVDCEYGNDWNPRCNTVARCYTQGFWQVNLPSTTPSTCPTPSGLNPGCPPTPAQATGACSPAGTACAYSSGLCVCTKYDLNPGSRDASTYEQWTCAAPDSHCGAARPRIGSACKQEGLECDYQICGSYGGDFLCTSGTWVEGNDINVCGGG